MEALRNYVLHGDLPIGKMNFRHRNIVVDGENKKVSDCSPKINLELLREDKNFKTSVLIELENYTEIDLRNHIRSFISDLSSIHRMFNEFQMEFINGITVNLLKLKESFKNSESVNGVRIVDSETSKGCSFEFDMLDRMVELINLNSTYHQINEMLITM